MDDPVASHVQCSQLLVPIPSTVLESRVKFGPKGNPEQAEVIAERARIGVSLAQLAIERVRDAQAVLQLSVPGARRAATNTPASS
jgi:hypothetical protein